MSAFWTRKMRTYFTRIDFDKDGAITRADFEGMAQRFCEKVKGEAAQKLTTSITAVWDEHLSHACQGKGINQESFIGTMNKQVHDPKLEKTLKGPLPLFFAVVDNNNDGMISEDEYGLFFSIIGLDPVMAPSSFQAIDTNNDGLLSLEEFVTAGTEFFTSEDESKPTKLFWGPLVQ